MNEKYKQPTMTDEAAEAWAAMGISKDFQIKRLTDLANMLEKRVAEFDPLYKAYHWGRMESKQDAIFLLPNPD